MLAVARQRGALVKKLAPVFFSSASGSESFTVEDVPLGSELHVRCGDAPVDVQVTSHAGKEEDVGIRVYGSCSAIFREENCSENHRDRKRYVLQLRSAGTSRAQCQAEIPPRYFGLHVDTGGHVDLMGGGIKEASDVSIHSRGGSITTSASISAERLTLRSDGGAIRASQVMASACIIDSRPKSQDTRSGPVHVTRASCLKLDVQAPGGNVRVESLISSAAAVCGGTIDVDSVNTLDGEAAFRVQGPVIDPEIRLGGVDGRVSLDDGAQKSQMEVQLNGNATGVHCRTTEGTKVKLYKPAGLTVHTEGVEPHGATVCRVEHVGEGASLEVLDRSWREQFEERVRLLQSAVPKR
jgi:hypothetical protein